MSELFAATSDWILDFAYGPWSVLALSINALTESIFFPVPPDLLLIAISALKPESAIWLAAITTGSSVVGALLGYKIGQTIGRRILFKIVKPSRLELAENFFKRYGIWAILVASLTPVPYKVFVILAGILRLDLRLFLIASLVGRSIRFFSLGALFYIFGEPIEGFVNSNFGLLTIAIAAVLVVTSALIFVLSKLSKIGKAPLN